MSYCSRMTKRCMLTLSLCGLFDASVHSRGRINRLTLKLEVSGIGFLFPCNLHGCGFLWKCLLNKREKIWQQPSWQFQFEARVVWLVISSACCEDFSLFNNALQIAIIINFHNRINLDHQQTFYCKFSLPDPIIFGLFTGAWHSAIT